MLMTLLQTTLDFTQEATDKLPGVTAQTAANPQAGFGIFLGGIMSAIMVFSTLFVLFYLLWGAITWITSAGDKGKLEKARNMITNAIIGIIVLSATTAIFVVVQRFLGISVLNFGGTSRSNTLQQRIDSSRSSTPTKTPATGSSGNLIQRLMSF